MIALLFYLCGLLVPFLLVLGALRVVLEALQEIDRLLAKRKRDRRNSKQGD